MMSNKNVNLAARWDNYAIQRAYINTRVRCEGRKEKLTSLICGTIFKGPDMIFEHFKCINLSQDIAVSLWWNVYRSIERWRIFILNSLSNSNIKMNSSCSVNKTTVSQKIFLTNKSGCINCIKRGLCCFWNVLCICYVSFHHVMKRALTTTRSLLHNI